MKTTFLKTIFLSVLLLAFTACSDDENASQVDENLNEEILTNFSENVVQSSYHDLKAKAALLNTNIGVFATEEGRTTANLNTLRDNWRAARAAWEQTESFLFGPVDSDAIDPRIDTWPVNFEDMLAIIESEDELTEAYIDNLGEDVKGFHPIEYLIFGLEGDKAAGDFTEREIEYLVGLGHNLQKLTTSVAESWDPAGENYHATFMAQSQEDAFLEMVEAMAGICDEVANAKIGEVYVAHDPSLEESPYSQNSLTDFTNNIKGVENVYLGKYTANGTGLEDLVRKHNLSLDGKIKAAISTATTSLANIDGTFGEAVETTNIKVETAIDAINDLHELLSTELAVFVQQHSK